MNRIQEEIRHFRSLEHIWFGQKTVAGQRRYDNRGVLFRKYCKPRETDKILEIGCGEGEFTNRLKRIGARVTAIDITPAVIDRSEKKLTFKGLNYKIDNCESLSFKDSSFSIVCGISILHHVNLRKTLREVFRVLTPGGRIFFTEPNIVNPIMYAQTNIGWLRKRMESSPRERALLRTDVERAMKNVGFHHVEVNNYDFLFPWIPEFMIIPLEKAGNILERIAIIKEFSGSLLIYAVK